MHISACVVLKIGAAGLLLASGVASSRADASCAGPSITVEPASPVVGEVIEIHGEGFGTDCNDTGGPGPALGDPQEDIDVRIVQGDVSESLIRLGADSKYEFAVRLVMPAHLSAGPAVFVASSTRLPVSLVAPGPAVSMSNPPPTILTGIAAGSLGGVTDRGDDESDGRSTGWIGWAGIGATAIAAVLVGCVVGRRRIVRP